MFLDIDGVAVQTVSFGSGHRTIVLIPGSFAPWEIWQQPMELLAVNHRVVSYDHYGSGLTDVPPEMVTFDNQVTLVGRLLDALGLEVVVLVGDSSNAAVAAAFALEHPDRVEALAFVAGGVTHVGDPATTRFVAGLRSDFERTLAGFVEFCIPEADAEHHKRWLAALIGRTGAERAALLTESYYGVDLMDRLPELRMPTAIVQGVLDRTPAGNVASAEAMAAALPDCMLVLLEDAGHVPQLTRPKAVAGAIEDLVARSGRAPAASGTA